MKKILSAVDTVGISGGRWAVGCGRGWVNMSQLVHYPDCDYLFMEREWVSAEYRKQGLFACNFHFIET